MVTEAPAGRYRRGAEAGRRARRPLPVHRGATFSYSDGRATRQNERVKLFFIAMIPVILVLIGSLFGLLRGRRDPMGSPEVLERARQRERELEDRERREEGN